MKKLILSSVIVLLTFVGVNAQTKKFQNINRVYSAGKGAIFEQNRVVGYYAFYKADKADRKNDNYILNILDDNLNTVKTKEIIRPHGDILLESAFNGKTFVFAFYNDKSMEYVAFDKTGNQTGTYKIEKLNRMEMASLMSYLTDDDKQPPVSFKAYGDKGFVKVSFTKNDKYGYNIQAFDNNLKVLWQNGSDENSNMVEGANVLFANDKVVVAEIMKKKNQLTKNFESYLAVLDANTGKTLTNKLCKDKNLYSIINCFDDTDKSEVVLVGEYFPTDDDNTTGKSEGIYLASIDYTGKETAAKKLSWATDLNKLRKLTEENNKIKENTRLMFHYASRMSDGTINLVGEQYKRGASALGIAASVLGGGRGGASTVQLNVGDMAVLSFDASFNPKTYDLIAKDGHAVLLPEGAAYWSAYLTAMYVKGTDQFDYSFSTLDKAKNKFVSIYTDNDRKGEDGKKAKVMLGVIKVEDAKVTKERVPLNSDASAFYILPSGKPGYIAVYEYYRKQKAASFRLEQVTY